MKLQNEIYKKARKRLEGSKYSGSEPHGSDTKNKTQTNYDHGTEIPKNNNELFNAYAYSDTRNNLCQNDSALENLNWENIFKGLETVVQNTLQNI